MFFAAGPDETSFPWLRNALALLAVAVLAVVAALRVPSFVSLDSPNFQKALDIWSDWLSGRHKTPRGFKRFVNKVRFLAMLERGEEAKPPTVLARLKTLFARDTAKAAGAAGADTLSPQIVAYAAILTRQPKLRWDDLTNISDGDTGSLQARLTEEENVKPEDIIAELRKTLDAHRAVDTFKDAADPDAWLPKDPGLRKLIEQVILPDEA